MAQAQEASFSFEKFIIPKYSYNDSEKAEVELQLQFFPKGRFLSHSSKFQLELDLLASDRESPDDNILQIKGIATFKFDNVETLDKVPSFFYKNAIAIFFPYLRAFISTLSLQSNTGLITLGLMNLSNLESDLIDNTIQISEPE
jgi:preprotein translocase subunit SecB